MGFDRVGPSDRSHAASPGSIDRPRHAYKIVPRPCVHRSKLKPPEEERGSCCCLRRQPQPAIEVVSTALSCVVVRLPLHPLLSSVAARVLKNHKATDDPPDHAADKHEQRPCSGHALVPCAPLCLVLRLRGGHLHHRARWAAVVEAAGAPMHACAYTHRATTHTQPHAPTPTHRHRSRS